jgi:hypothetical protein
MEPPAERGLKGIHYLDICLCLPASPASPAPLQMGYYNISDFGLLLANLQCGAQDKQYNQTLCESTTLNFFTTS